MVDIGQIFVDELPVTVQLERELARQPKVFIAVGLIGPGKIDLVQDIHQTPRGRVEVDKQKPGPGIDL